MIRAKITRSGITVQGHATQEPEQPEDSSVCTAVSVLTQVLQHALTEIAHVELYRCKEDDGLISFEWDDLSPGACVLIDAWALGMRDLAESYPGTIQICSEL